MMFAAASPGVRCLGMLGRGLCARPMLPQRTVGQAPSAWRSISISATSDSSLSTDASATNASIHGSVPELVATDGGMHATTYANEIAQVAADATAAVGGAAVAEALPAVEIVTEAIPYFRPYSPATIMCNTLEAVHTTTGLPWWATVAACTLTARACLLPVIVYTMKNGAKMALMKPEMDAVQARFKAEQRTDPTAQARFQRDAQALMTKYDVHPARMLIGPLSQAPIFISFFMATRRLAEYNPEVAEEAFLWVPSIAEADPLFVLPVCASITMLTIAQLGGDTGNDAQKEQMEKFRKVMSIAAIGVFPLTYWMPSLTFCYWISSNSFSCFQVPLMRQPAVKRAFGIPIVPTAAADTPKKPITAAEVVVPGQASAMKYAHPGSFKPARSATASGEQDSPVLDAEFTDVTSSGEQATVRRRRRNSKGKGKRR